MRAYPRPALVAKLLRERNVARFMVAPSGFGKSTLALEYAETVFAFDHVFWIDCASPCFLRDLDARGIVDDLVEVDDQSFLAVFEDVPPLDSLCEPSCSAPFSMICSTEVARFSSPARRRPMCSPTRPIACS